ncbi:ABC transporter permease [Mycolicibacterium wolinskyi]|uniref:ABC transporter permease n=1 Tax=Mycolicibacterium wolinskyi TaxID=59750 RepID=UPI0039178914
MTAVQEVEEVLGRGQTTLAGLSSPRTRLFARYLVGRITQAVVVLWLAYTLTFVAITLLPSNPIDMFAADDTGVIDPQTVEQMKLYYGYDHGVLQRYFIELSHVVRGTLGYSMSTGQTVTQAIGEAALPTLRLTVTAFAAAVLIATAIVSTATLTSRRWLRSLVVLLPPLFAAAPVFWVGIVVLNVLSFRLGWISAFPDGTFLSILVPSLVLGLPLSAALAQVLLKSVETVAHSDFVDVVRAKGAGKHWVFWRHVVRNAAGPGLTVAGTVLGTLVGGAVVTETVFARAGIGRVLQTAVSQQDVSLVQGFILIIAGVYVVVNLVIDLLYPALDPRILLTTGGARG